MTAVISVSEALDAGSAEALGELALAAATVDGVDALSEASWLALRSTSPEGTVHLVARGQGADQDALLGYAQVWPDGSAELVVAPRSRRAGVGGRLWRAAHEAGAARVWAHGDLPAAQAMAGALGLVAVRSLLRMGRALTVADRTPRPLPPGYAALTYAERTGDSADASAALTELAALNAAAFAGHPEQGRLTVTDLAARMAEPWFDPHGLILVLDEAGAPVAFHWTKIEPDQDPGAMVGEVYVVGVHPAYQGRGLAGPLTSLGLAHLAGRGCADVILYVDGENAAARATYDRAGLRVVTTDRVYAPADRPR